MRTSTRSLAALWSLLAVVASCSDPSVGAPETVAPTDAPTTVATTTTSTLPPPTTLPESAVFLRSDGFGPFSFGTPYNDDFRAGMPLVRGSDDGRKFPVDAGNGYFVTDDGLDSFRYPRARSVCFDDGHDAVNGYLCAFFGGPDPDTLTFVGWSYFSRTGPGGLFSSHGITVNALVSNVPGIPLPEGGCTSHTIVEVDGMFVELVSDSGASFGEDSAGVFVPADPQPADARVSRVIAGDTFLGKTELECPFIAAALGFAS